MVLLFFVSFAFGRVCLLFFSASCCKDVLEDSGLSDAPSERSDLPCLAFCLDLEFLRLRAVIPCVFGDLIFTFRVESLVLYVLVLVVIVIDTLLML